MGSPQSEPLFGPSLRFASRHPTRIILVVLVMILVTQSPLKYKDFVELSAAKTVVRRIIQGEISNLTADARMSLNEPSESPSPLPSLQPTAEPVPIPEHDSSKSLDAKFPGSKITSISMGMDLFENVCLVKNAEGMSQLQSYTADAADMNATFGTGPNGWHYLKFTHGQPLEMWYNVTANMPLIKTDVLLTLVFFENPGHCISDYMMPLIRDRYERQTLKKLEKGIPEYPNWVRLRRKVVNYDPRSYCNQLLQAAGFVQKQGFISHRQMCFERLYVPATEQQRFPFNHELIPIAKYELQVEGFRKSLLLPGGANLSAPEYPTEALHEFRHTLWQNMNLRGEPWTDQETKAVDNVGPLILFYNRFGSGREWNTSHEVADILQQGYHVKIDVIGEEWKSFNFTQQAQLYNNYSHVVTVHGAHLANLIFSRPGTQVIEIVPIPYKGLRPDESLKHRDDAKDQRDWYGPLGWFSSFTRQVGIEHFSLHCENHITSVLDAKKMGMFINATRAANFIVNRFGLKPRDGHTVKLQ